jgi:Ca-activated chloride channel family protein
MLQGVYQHLGSRLQVQTRETELTGLLALTSAMFALAAAGLSVLWFGRGP